jgi:uncharacterized protein YraI
MKITIQGKDYSASLDVIHPLTIERKLNEPSLCRLYLSLPSGGSLPTPARNQSVAVAGDDGTQYFTGYIAASPAPVYAGMSIDGPFYRFAIQALSDEFLLDQLQLSPNQGAAGITAGELITSLVLHTRSASLNTEGVALAIPVGGFAPEPGASWSKCAASVAGQARAAYRVLGGALQLSQIPFAVHPLNEIDGSLNLSALAVTSGARRGLANDITVCGELEPAAFVTEYFLGDGLTTQFKLAAEPFFPPASRVKIIDERFNEPNIDLSRWRTSGGAGSISLGAGGLAMNGGTGVDGQTLLTWIDEIEMGGTLLIEATGVTLSPGSTGILGGFLSGLDTLTGCVAGFQATAQPGTGAVSLQPVVQGVTSGMTYPTNPANQYALRIWIHCPESQRSLSTYRSFGDSGMITFGGQGNSASAKLLFEIQEYVNGVAAMPVKVYDGSITSLPQTCSLAAVSSINMVGSMRGLSLTNLGSGWVVSTPPNGGQYTRRQGTLAEAGELYLERTGTLVFYSGYVPLTGERISVSYRTRSRAIGRAVNAISQQELAAAGLPSTATWLGSVTNPPARNSADCRNAAATMVAASASVSALWSGTYKAPPSSFSSDVWPGDALQLDVPSLGLNSQVVIRAVKLTYGSCYPELVTYEISFANDWADDLAVTTSRTVPADAWLPAPIAPTVLPNLTNLAVTAISGTAVTINTGTAPPAGGGFEIRRRDFGFMAGEDTDLVMRGTQQTMTFARASGNDHFYIRMYDGLTPPNYSEYSTALLINLPLGS